MKPIASEGNNQGHQISGFWPMFVQLSAAISDLAFGAGT